MNPAGKRRRWALRAAVAVCGLCILLLVANVVWEYVGVCYVAPGRAWGAYGGSGYGGLLAGWGPRNSLNNQPYAVVDADGLHIVSWPHDEPWDNTLAIALHVAIYPQIQFDSQVGWAIALPLWIPLFLSGVSSFLFWRTQRRERAHGACTGCGYDLTGNESGRCPECGAALVAVRKDGGIA